MSLSSNNKSTSAKKKDKLVQIRINADLYLRASEQAKNRGRTLSSVVRSFLEMFASEWPGIDPKDIGRIADYAPRSKQNEKEGGHPTPPISGEDASQ